MKPFLKCSLTATKANYSGQKVISQLKALRSNEIKHRMCLEARNIVDNLYNKYKIAGFIDKPDYQTLLNAYFTYVCVVPPTPNPRHLFWNPNTPTSYENKNKFPRK